MKNITLILSIIFFIASCSESTSPLDIDSEIPELKEGCFTSYGDPICISEIPKLLEIGDIEEHIFLKCKNNIEEENESHHLFGPSSQWESLIERYAPSNEILEQEGIMDLITPVYLRISLYKMTEYRQNNPNVRFDKGEFQMYIPKISTQTNQNTGDIENIPFIDKSMLDGQEGKFKCSQPDCKKYVSSQGSEPYTDTEIDRENLIYLSIRKHRDFSFQTKLECELIDNNFFEEDFNASFADLFQQFEKKYNDIKDLVKEMELKKQKRAEEIKTKSKI